MQLEYQLQQISQLKSEAALLESSYTEMQSQMLGLQQKLMAKEGRLGELEAAYKVSRLS
jgi:chromosome segregation ATPase